MPANSEEYARPATPPDTSNLSEVRGASRECTACHLYKRATQTVFGEGPKDAPIMLVGEQPVDYEDVAGKPFVGPAGKIMDRALEEAEIDRSLPSMARGGAASGQTSTRRLSRIDRGTGVFRSVVPRHAGTRKSSIVE